MKTLMITGGAGFIGSNYCHYVLRNHPEYRVVVYDKLTYAGNLDNLTDLDGDPRYTFVHGDICDAAKVRETIRQLDVEAIVNFAAETHVDRSLSDPGSFILTDVYGTHVLIEATRELGLERYHQVSTDEVYGQVLRGSSVETDPIQTRSPYAASKAGGDLLVLAYFTSFGVPVTITRGSNNIGPYQYPEKVVPVFITNALDNLPLPIYGDGLQMRDYQYVEDHCEGIDIVLHRGKLGEVYNLGTGVETRNIDMARVILDLLGKPLDLLQYITDRPGHDRRYSLNVDKMHALGWRSSHTFAQAIEKTVRWYVDHEGWWRKIKSGELYRQYYQSTMGGARSSTKATRAKAKVGARISERRSRREPLALGTGGAVGVGVGRRGALHMASGARPGLARPGISPWERRISLGIRRGVGGHCYLFHPSVALAGALVAVTAAAASHDDGSSGGAGGQPGVADAQRRRIAGRLD